MCQRHSIFPRIRLHQLHIMRASHDKDTYNPPSYACHVYTNLKNHITIGIISNQRRSFLPRSLEGLATDVDSEWLGKTILGRGGVGKARTDFSGDIRSMPGERRYRLLWRAYRTRIQMMHTSLSIAVCAMWFCVC
ncbi:hypothetical protein KVT40_006338 [Elsinoe batatas]|uniref:Uncharacterized protein n=1 Tax=Elsinoe batatas TaxID=2601811 RepID=A0A8K0PEU6_9PEZI|nr:hypothetical protein KVT40_006338 [Elsinoe batatas]